jgi:hypothetical protein
MMDKVQKPSISTVKPVSIVSEWECRKKDHGKMALAGKL